MSVSRRLISAGLPAPSQITTSKRRAQVGQRVEHDRRAARACSVLVGAGVGVAERLAHQRHLAAALARGLEQDRVHRGLGLEPGGRRLHRLGAADLGARRAVTNELSAMFCALNGATRTPWRASQRQSGGDDRLAGVGVRAGDEQRSAHTRASRPPRRVAAPAAGR